MNSSIESYIKRESVWPDSFDDSGIDDIIWSEIRASSSAGDFASYLVHRPQRAKYLDEALQRYESVEGRPDNTPVCYLRAIERIRGLAGRGDAGAMFHLGKIYSLGIAVGQDLAAAEMWYLRAIDRGEIRAHCNLGWLYQSGFGLLPQKEKAFELLSIGADQGVLAARASVGLMLLSGEGCQANPVRGIGMLEAAFHNGYNNAANCLADVYFAGKDVPQDSGLGLDWLKRATERGDVRTMAILGHYLITGSHGRVDVARGVAYMFGAINRGYTPARLWLGTLYVQGWGVARNPAMARMLFEGGAAAGDESCQSALTGLTCGALSPPAPDTSRLN